MRKVKLTLLLVSAFTGSFAQSADSFTTPNGKSLRITFIGHGTLMMEYENLVIHVDPWSKLASYDKLPKADIVLVTHHHADHLDSAALVKVCKVGTEIYWTQTCSGSSSLKPKSTIMHNGDRLTTHGVEISAVPAYNLIHMTPGGTPFHVKGEGNGYILNFDGFVVYVAGDTEDIPEMKGFGRVDIAFLPMNLPYTMTPEMVHNAATMLHPKILYPYHYGDTDTNALLNIMKTMPEVDVRIRNLK
ncbi:MAG: MBL fold metallo-hydrolase [Bacteroidales bacterium]|nr:MBL fold metallo-hydrolase [Bacteroidales bacterium]HNT42032.1 MBL fold metallo-hydrolase [Tenuifilaceae bacterium]MBP8644397.1 MBL fold metallo-hydrolase [Bacteroidales bacterium]HOA10536.1 MBL fold metallo-hydrolase [Tenuifilaceae bacterium]HOC37399.1 MBL fold metallo-hydrolase [Tenuifilaceae bacterium]